MFRLGILNLNNNEIRTFRFHAIYRILEGMILGVLALNEYIFLRSMEGSSYQLAFLFQFSMVVFIFLIFFNAIRKRIYNKKLMLRYTVIITRLPLMTLLFFPHNYTDNENIAIYHYIFLGLFLVYYLGNIIIFPAINVLLKTNYRHQNFGKLYSYATSLNKIVMLVSTFVAGILLDKADYIFVYIYPVVALAEITGVFFLSRIDYSNVPFKRQQEKIRASITGSVRGMIQILKTNRPYLHFEIGFMFYGFAFMLSYPIINIYFKEVLYLNYTSVAFYKNAYNILAIIFLPFFGRLLGNIDPRKFASLTFGSMLIYIFFMMLTEHLPWHFQAWNIKIYYTLIFSFLFYGVFAATMSLLWNIGSAYFCEPGESDDYQSLHLSLTGIRSLFSPILGVYFYVLLGFTWTFIIAIAALLSAMLLMKYSYEHRYVK